MWWQKMTRARPAVNLIPVLLLWLPAVAGAQGLATPAAPPTVPSPPDPSEAAGSVTDAAPTPLDLRTVVARARAADYRVQAALAQVDVFEANHQEALWAWFPSFTTTLAFGGPVPEARLRPGATSALDVTDASQEGDWNFGRMGVLARARIEAAVPLWTFGKLSGYQDALGDVVQAGQSEVARKRDEAGLDAARAFYGYQAARRAIEELDGGIARAQAAEKRVRALLDAGSEQVLPEDIQKTRLLVHHLQAQRARLVEARATALSALGLLAGLPAGTVPAVVSEDLTLPEGPVPELATLVERARSHRPELAAVESALSARRRAVEVRRAMYYPDLLLAGFGDVAWSNAATDVKSPFVWDPYNYLDAGVGLLLRGTFDLPQKNARMEAARAEVRKLEAQQALLDRAIALEVEEAWRSFKAAQAEALRLTEAARDGRRWAVSALSSFELGLVPVRDVLEPIALSAGTSSLLAQAVHRARVAEARLAKAVGLQPWELSPGPGAVPADG